MSGPVLLISTTGVGSADTGSGSCTRTASSNDVCLITFSSISLSRALVTATAPPLSRTGAGLMLRSPRDSLWSASEDSDIVRAFFGCDPPISAVCRFLCFVSCWLKLCLVENVLSQ